MNEKNMNLEEIIKEQQEKIEAQAKIIEKQEEKIEFFVEKANWNNFFINDMRKLLEDEDIFKILIRADRKDFWGKATANAVKPFYEDFDFLRKYKEHISWNIVIEKKGLLSDIVQEHKEYLDYDYISNWISLSESYIAENLNRLNLKRVCVRSSVSLEFALEHGADLDNVLYDNRNLSESVRKEMKEYVRKQKAKERRLAKSKENA